jgi:hypothetical protein
MGSCYNFKNADVSEMNGLTVSEIDVGLGDDRNAIQITTTCGRVFLFYHEQDCCESVRIYDQKGDLRDLKGMKLKSVELAIVDNPDDVAYESYDHTTWTEIRFHVTDKTIISRWVGESNGYYSEHVDFSEITNEGILDEND